MAAANPYRTPAAPVADDSAEEFSEVKVFSAAGRIGRVRYIGYSVGMTLVFYAVMSLGVAVSAGAGIEALGIVLMGAGVIGMLIVAVMLTVQRCHDFDVSGWLALLLVVPLAPFLFWIIPGTRGSNRFGAPTPPNSTGVVILALILPLLFVVGIVAAIALPAYQDYVQRARTAEELQQQSGSAGDASLEADGVEADEAAPEEEVSADEVPPEEVSAEDDAAATNEVAAEDELAAEGSSDVAARAAAAPNRERP